jgi:hypothetical protein
MKENEKAGGPPTKGLVTTIHLLANIEDEGQACDALSETMRHLEEQGGVFIDWAYAGTYGLSNVPWLPFAINEKSANVGPGSGSVMCVCGHTSTEHSCKTGENDPSCNNIECECMSFTSAYEEGTFIQFAEEMAYRSFRVNPIRISGTISDFPSGRTSVEVVIDPREVTGFYIYGTYVRVNVIHGEMLEVPDVTESELPRVRAELNTALAANLGMTQELREYIIDGVMNTPTPAEWDTAVESVAMVVATTAGVTARNNNCLLFSDQRRAIRDAIHMITATVPSEKTIDRTLNRAEKLYEILMIDPSEEVLR